MQGYETMMKTPELLLIGAVVVAGAVAVFARPRVEAKAAVVAETPKDAKTMVLGGGCFWCVEAIYEDLKGVLAVENGYAGGDKPNPTYAEVCSGTSGHAEVVKLTYDPKEVSADDLLRIFFTTHNPTTKNRQGNDVGTQYRSVVFYEDEAQKALAKKIIAEVTAEAIWKDPIVTTLEPLRNYSRAEEYHQDYFAKYERASEVERMGMNSGYCAAIIQPKVIKFRQKYADKLRKKG